MLYDTVMASSRTKYIITHTSGTQFAVFLTEYEINKCQQDEQFANELTEKYYKLYQNGLVSTTAANRLSGESQVAKTPRAETLISSPSTSNVLLVEDNGDEITGATPTGETESCWGDRWDVEELISLVAQRPPLYDFRLPLQERSRSIVRELWEEIITELQVNMSVEEVAKKWKNLRDSYIRARANINKKLKSGSPLEDKQIIDKLKARHPHYDAFNFLDTTLTRRSTSTNLDNSMTNVSHPASTSSSGVSERPTTPQGSTISHVDQAFLDAVGKVATPTAHSETYHYCMRLAAGLDKLPQNVKNKLELEFFQKVVEAEALYCQEK